MAPTSFFAAITQRTSRYRSSRINSPSSKVLLGFIDAVGRDDSNLRPPPTLDKVLLEIF